MSESKNRKQIHSSSQFNTNTTIVQRALSPTFFASTFFYSFCNDNDDNGRTLEHRQKAQVDALVSRLERHREKGFVMVHISRGLLYSLYAFNDICISIGVRPTYLGDMSISPNISVPHGPSSPPHLYSASINESGNVSSDIIIMRVTLMAIVCNIPYIDLSGFAHRLTFIVLHHDHIVPQTAME